MANLTADASSAAIAHAQAVFGRSLAGYLGRRVGSVRVMAVDLSTGAAVRSGAHFASHAASVAKVDILAALLLLRQDAGGMPSPTECGLAEQMITASANDAACELWERIGGAQGLARANARLGLEETVQGPGGLWGLTLTTVADQVRLLSVLTGTGGAVLRSGSGGRVGALGQAQQVFAVGLLERVIDEQRWGVAAAAAGPGAVALKNGWLPYSADGHRWLVNSVGRVRTARGHAVLIAVLTRYSPDLAYGIETVERVSRLAASALDRV